MAEVEEANPSPAAPDGETSSAPMVVPPADSGESAQQAEAGEPAPAAPPAPPAKAVKKRAVEMDETLDMSADLTHAIENLTAKQQETAQAMRNAKKRLKELQEQIAAYESEAAALAAEQEATKSAMSKQSEELSKAREEYETLHQSQTWTRSALDSALGAQEEYRKGYTTMRAELLQTKDELQAISDQLAQGKEAQEELQQLRDQYERMSRRAKANASKVLGRLTDSSDTSLSNIAYQAWLASLVEVRMEKEIEAATAEAKERLDEFLARNKATSRSVLDRVSAGTDAGVLSFCFATWRTAVRDDQEARLLEGRIGESKKRIEAFKSQKQSEARQILDRMSASSETGLLSMIVGCWLLCVQDQKREREVEVLMKSQEEKLKEVMHKKNAEARAILQRSVGTTISGTMSQVLKAWSEVVLQEVRERAMAAEVQQKLHDLQSKRKAEAMSVLDHIAGKRDRELLMTIINVWKSGASELKRKKQIEKEYREQCQQDMQDLSNELELVKETAAKVKEQIQTKYIEGSETLRQEIEQMKKELLALDDGIGQARSQLESKTAGLDDLKEELQKSRGSHSELRTEVKKMLHLHSAMEGGIDEIVRS
mmetsp:Transcript_51437/g.122289  ORF Transcript_51437/g.122289 Transcript_51437/m.122289 type:complete len:599 (-) Transcript_51437:83-1879(-)